MAARWNRRPQRRLNGDPKGHAAPATTSRQRRPAGARLFAAVVAGFSSSAGTARFSRRIACRLVSLNRCPQRSAVIWIEACPSCALTYFMLSPWLISSDAYVVSDHLIARNSEPMSI